MQKSRTKVILAAVAVLAMLAVAAVPYYDDSDDSSAGKIELINDGNVNIHYIYDGGDISLAANSSTSFVFYLYNVSTASDVLVTVSATTDNDKVSITTDPSSPTISADDICTITVYLDADRYAHQGSDYTITVTVSAYLLDSSTAETASTGSFDINLSVSSDLSSENKYNKFLGYFDNNLDGFMGEAWFTALVSFFGFLAIGYAVMFIAVPLCVRIVMKKDDPDRDYMKKTLYELCHVIILLWAIGQVLRIVGTAEEYIDIINRIFYLCYLIVGCIVGWRLYKLIIDVFITRMAKKDDRHKKDYESLRPLFLYLGEITIAVVAVIIALSMFGVDVAAIITSAGLVSLGISLGAKDVLSQFFSGIVILATRPFQKGDLIQIGNDETVYRVREVNIMNTELENWDNTDINIMPNSTIETSRIRNITGETNVYKCYISMTVSYDSDLNKVRQVMQDVASANPHVITDGSYGRPYTRVESFGDNNIEVKMGLYVDDFNTSYTVRGQIRQALYKAFQDNGISIDYSRIVVEDGGKAFPNEGGDQKRPRSKTDAKDDAKTSTS